jgi:DNA-binding NarL/FixJ family response regulator
MEDVPDNVCVAIIDDDESYEEEALEAGCAAFFRKTDEDARLLGALRKVLPPRRVAAEYIATVLPDVAPAIAGGAGSTCHLAER